MASGIKHTWGSLEESLAILGTQRRAEIEFRKTLTIVNAILEVGNRIVAAVSQSDAPSSGKALQKGVESLQELMLPHLGDNRDRQAAKIKKVLEEEHSKGPLKIKAVGGHKAKMHGKVNIVKKET
jgi:hypothetical protein